MLGESLIDIPGYSDIVYCMISRVSKGINIVLFIVSYYPLWHFCVTLHPLSGELLLTPASASPHQCA